MLRRNCDAAAGSTLAAGGSIGDAIKSAAISFAQAVVFTEFVGPNFGDLAFPGTEIAHGIVNGAFTVAQGGKFYQGFAAGALGAVGGRIGATLFDAPEVNPSPGGVIGRTVVAAIAGGTGSAITGGKFANGAAAAAIGQLFNAEMWAHRRLGHSRQELERLSEGDWRAQQKTAILRLLAANRIIERVMSLGSSRQNEGTTYGLAVLNDTVNEGKYLLFGSTVSRLNPAQVVYIKSLVSVQRVYGPLRGQGGPVDYHPDIFLRAQARQYSVGVESMVFSIPPCRFGCRDSLINDDFFFAGNFNKKRSARGGGRRR